MSDPLLEPLTVRTFLLAGESGEDDTTLISQALAEHQSVAAWGTSLAKLCGSAQELVTEKAMYSLPAGKSMMRCSKPLAGPQTSPRNPRSSNSCRTA
jgi:hypothetical protein